MNHSINKVGMTPQAVKTQTGSRKCSCEDVYIINSEIMFIFTYSCLIKKKFFLLWKGKAYVIIWVLSMHSTYWEGPLCPSLAASVETWFLRTCSHVALRLMYVFVSCFNAGLEEWTMKNTNVRIIAHSFKSFHLNISVAPPHGALTVCCLFEGRSCREPWPNSMAPALLASPTRSMSSRVRPGQPGNGAERALQPGVLAASSP